MKKPVITCGVALTLMLNIFTSAVFGDIVVKLKEESTVRSTQVLLRDVATVTSRDSIHQVKAGAIELIQLDDLNLSQSIAKNAVRNRLLLAGWSLTEFTITGSSSVNVTFREPQTLTDTDVEQAAHKAMLEIIKVNPDDLTVCLQNIFVPSLQKDIREMDELRVEVTPQKPSVGLVMMSVRILRDKQLLFTRTAAFNVRKRQRVAIARVSLTRDVTLDDRSVLFENRFVTSDDMDELDPSQVFGQSVRANIAAGSILQLRDIQTSRTGAVIVVKKGESVKVIAVAGKLQTVLHNAEAMQDGGIGDTIRLMNRDTQREIFGKVLGPGMIKIQIR